MNITKPIAFSRTVLVETEIVISDCPSCGIQYGVGADFRNRRREDHETWYCPNGHSVHFPHDNEAERLRKELAQAEQQKKWARDEANAERARRLTADRRAAAARGQVTKIKNRVAKGVCPCCNRTFANLARHMEGQHPEFAPVTNQEGKS